MNPVIIGDATLYLGDCIDVLPLIGKVDVLLTDPPYGIINEFGSQSRKDGSRILQFAWDSEHITETVLTALDIALTLIEKSAFVFCGLDQVSHITDLMRVHHFTPKPAAWVKKCPPPAMPGNWWPSGFEIATYCYRTGAYFGDMNSSRSNVFIADSYRHGQPGKVDHPTQKPLKLMEKLVSAMVPPNGSCLDIFMGSGSTGVAAVALSRKFIGIERDERYFEIACKRIEQAVAQGQLFTPEPMKQEQEKMF